MPSKRKPWSMFPALHEDVEQLLSLDGLAFEFNANDDDIDAIREYDTNIMGRFACYNQTCPSSGWGSRKVPITIRLYTGDRYNARVYHQRCKDCQRLSRPNLDSSYADRIVYRLKKWEGIEQDRPVFVKKSKKPHHSNLCEGCKHGHCKDGRLD